LLSNKSRKRKRNLKGNHYVDSANRRLAEQMLVL
jgi:ribosomal protein L35